MENSIEAPQKTESRTTIWSSNASPRVYPKECKSGYNKDTCTAMFIAVLFTIAKLWKQPRCRTTEEQIKKMWYFVGILFSH
jgi:hypothetical protein